MPPWPFPGPGHMVASAHADHQPWGASCLHLGSGSCPGAGPPATCQEPGGAESSATGILSCLGSHCLKLLMGSAFQAHLTKTFWNIPPPTSPKTGFQPDNRSPGSPDPRAQLPGPGLAFPGPHQAATWGGPGGQQGGRDPAPPTLSSCPDTSLSSTPGGRFTEVEVTSEFPQMYKIHISVHVFGAVSSQEEGGSWPGAGPPTSVPNLQPRGRMGHLPPRGPRGPAELHTGRVRALSWAQSIPGLVGTQVGASAHLSGG